MLGQSDIRHRVLSGSETRAFRTLELTPLNWAALVAAPFFLRGKPRPNLANRTDGTVLERLRRELRTASGLSDETLRLWRRFGSAPDDELAQLGTQLLAWHFATDLSFARRERLLDQIAEGERTIGTARGAIAELRLLIDLLLPSPSFPDGFPPWSHVPLPKATALDALQSHVSTFEWTGTPPSEADVGALVRLVGPPNEWWGRVAPGRRAVERGVAMFSFAERTDAIAAIEGEWTRARDDSSARSVVYDIREWVDAVRKSARGEPVSQFSPPVSLDRPRGASSSLSLVAPTGKRLRVVPGSQVGRMEYRELFGALEASTVASDQFVIQCDALGAWRVRPCVGTSKAIWVDGNAVPPEGAALAPSSAVTIEGALKLLAIYE